MKHSLIRFPISVFICILTILLPLSVSGQQNPFLTTGGEQTNETTKTDNPEAKPKLSTAENKIAPFFDSALMYRIRKLQKKIQAKVSAQISLYKTQGKTKSFFTFMAFSFLYGLLHVLGPGHRKVFLFTYFISRSTRWKKGMLAGAMTAILHAVSAIIFIGGMYLITTKALLSCFNDVTPVIEKTSYAIIVLIGVWLIINHILSIVRGGNISEKDDREPDTLMFVLAAGLVPCPGAATIMIFSLAMSVPAIGIMAVLSMSIGMAVILTLIPPAAILLQNRIEPLLSRSHPETGIIIHSAISIAGALALIFFGLMFLL